MDGRGRMVRTLPIDMTRLQPPTHSMGGGWISIVHSRRPGIQNAYGFYLNSWTEGNFLRTPIGYNVYIGGENVVEILVPSWEAWRAGARPSGRGLKQ